MTSTLTDAPLIRMTIAPSPENGLRAPSQIMVDKAMSVRFDKLGTAFGRLGDAEMVQVSRSVALFRGIAG